MTNTPSRWIAIPALLALATMLGCQGISVGKSSAQPAPTVTGTIAVTPATINFGIVQTGTTQSQTSVLANTSSSSVTVTQATVTGYGFSTTGLTLPLTLTPQQSASFHIVFSPTAVGSASGSLAFSSNGSASSLNVALSGTGAAPGSVGAGNLIASPTTFNFGNVPIGSNQTQAETVTNTGSQNLTISAGSINAPFAVTGLTLPLTLAPNQSSTFGIGFTPAASGPATGTLSLSNTGSNTSVSVSVSGTGVAPGVLTASPTALTFANVQVGQNQSQTETVQNTGSTNVTIAGSTVSGTGFTLSGIATPLTLAPGQSASFSVTLTPPSAGNFSGSVSISSNASDPNLATALSGTAVTPATLTATPTSLAFTNVVVGQNQTQTETVKNTGGVNATISAATVSGTGFSISGISAPLTLTPGQSASFSVTLSPSSSGNFSGSVSVTSNAANPNLSVPLSGTAVPLGTLTATPASLTFTGIVLGQNQSQTETLKNTGGSNITISAATESGNGFSISGITTPLTLTPGQSASFDVTFTPQSANNFNGSISIASNASNPSLTMALSGTGVALATLTATPASLTFTNVVVGQSQTQTETVMNTGGESATISAATVSGTGFSISGISTPLTLTPGQSAAFNVTFTPPSANNFSGSISVTSNASNPSLTVSLSGTGTAPAPGTLGVSPITIAAGSVVVGASGTASGTLTASGANVTVSSVTLGGTNPSEFSISGISFPVTVTPSQPVAFTVTFTPGATGAASAAASFASNASNAPTIAGLTGAGTAAAVHTVSLNWTASITTGITSYNVYRVSYTSGACAAFPIGSPYSSTASTVTTFTDSTVTDGDAYCYATTAVDPSGESGVSNVVQVTIP